MEMLPSSGIQCAGESSSLKQSSGTKSSDGLLAEQPALLQVDCSKQCQGIPESEMVVLEANGSQKTHNGDNKQLGDSYKDEICIPPKPTNESLNVVHTAEETLKGVVCSVQNQEDEPSANVCQEKRGFIHTYSPQKYQCSLPNGSFQRAAFFEVEVSCKQNLVHLRGPELHPCSNPFLSPECKEQAAEASNRLYEVVEQALRTEDAQTCFHKKVKEQEDAKPNSGSFPLGSLQSGLCGGELSNECQVLSLEEPNLNKFKHSILPMQNEDNRSLCAANSSSSTMPSLEDVQYIFNEEAEFDNFEAEPHEQDCTAALWVKWRGKWQTCIRCSRADCPLPTLRAKPTHDRKKYAVVFFPHTRTYSWADMQLVRSIDEFPTPLAYGSHYSWLSLVNDLTISRRYIMRKLAVSMLNISDQLHTEAVIESARRAASWKEFALEASQCRSYSDLGKMLLKLQKMILPGYISPDWHENSFDSWVQRCQSAQTAESVELLTKDLVDSVLWNDVEELWNAPVQPELGSEWRTWKQEAMKWFYTSHPICSTGDSVQQSCDDSVGVGPQISRKRPKLDIRRSDVYASEAETGRIRSLSIAKVDLQCKETDSSSLGCYSQKVRLGGIDVQTASRNKSDHYDGIIIGDMNLKNVQTAGVGSSEDASGEMPLVSAELASSKKYRRCSAFIEAKGRQCGRWANDGDIYCCVHLNLHSATNSSVMEQVSPSKTSMCEGTTTHGKKCKHRARAGSAFCKKHRCQGSLDLMDQEMLLTSSENKLKRKHGEDKLSENISSSNGFRSDEIALMGEVQAPFPENLVPVVVRETLDEGNCLMNKAKLYDALPTTVDVCNADIFHCIGYGNQNFDGQCLENAKRHNLYCEKHIPNFLKRARNGKSRLISKEVFINLLRNCTSRKEKVHLHRSCELLYSYMKSSLSHQKSSKGDLIGWILSEASKDLHVGEYLLKLISSERYKIGTLWGFDAENDNKALDLETKSVPVAGSFEKGHDSQMGIKCKICAEEFSDDQTLGVHWMEIHKKEAQWLFRGYACAICMNSFTNRKVLEAHVTERHGMQFLEHSILLQCMSCNSHFPNPEKLWEHILSFHSMDFRLPAIPQQHVQSPKKSLKIGSAPSLDSSAAEKGGYRRFICKFCGLTFDLLPDLGRHHQAAHMSTISMSRLQRKRTNRNLKTVKYRYPRFKKGSGAAFRIKNSTNFGMKKHFQASSSVIAARLQMQTRASDTVGLGNLSESDCSNVAQTLFTEVHQTKPHPSNHELLAISQSACCQTNIHDILVEKYGTPPQNLYIRAAKLCSELNIPINWHLDGFVCPNGCKPFRNLYRLDPLVLLSSELPEPSVSPSDDVNDGEWEVDECHHILSPRHFSGKPFRKSVVLCEDVSSGKESVPVACVIDEDLKHLLNTNSEEILGQNCRNSMPWLGFTYVTERLLDPSLCLDTSSSQLRCACQQKCLPGTCDHVYLFNNDYENAKDVYGKSTHGRFPYDERGQVILEEGYLVYECNSMCSCDKSCQNRVLQHGLKVKLEVFRTEKKGWAVRAGEPIPRGTFVCEYIGEVLNDVEANKRGERYDTEGCSYLYDIDAHIDDAEQLSEVLVPYVIDATNYGNVSRFINHSCSPNLVNYQVLVESMDCQLAHIGLYASRDIAAGEELMYDYRYKLLPGDGCPCHCGSSNCRGRLY